MQRPERTSPRTDRPREEKLTLELPSTKQIGSSPPKLNGRLASHKCLASLVPTVRGFKHARASNTHSAHESDPMRHQPGIVYFFFHSPALTQTPRRPPPRHHRSHCRCSATKVSTDSIHPTLTPASTAAVNITISTTSHTAPTD
ncbi:hypothetical protein SprV_0902745600 [Sparganum proliferum]